MTNSNTTTTPTGLSLLYGMPGANTFFEIPDIIQDVNVSANASNQTIISSFLPLAADNIVFGYKLLAQFAQVATVSTGTITPSPYFPYNILQNISLNYQSQFKPIDVASGLDLLLFDMIRPNKRRGILNGYQFSYDAVSPIEQASQNQYPPFNQTQTPSALTNINLTYNLPVSVYLDDYYDLSTDGAQVLAYPVPAVISPQYMAGTNRNVKLNATLAAISSSSYDFSPYDVVSPATVTLDGTFNVYRNGVFNTNNPATLPPIYNWQYQRLTETVNLTGQKVTIPLNSTSGQLLSVYVRLYDPVANASIDISTIKSITVQTGGTLNRFVDTPTTVQQRFQEQHGYLLPSNVFAYDFAIDVDGSGRLTNSTAVNTLTTASPTIQIEFLSAPSASAYAVVGSELLVPIKVGS